ncbi:MAG: pyridoxamine 5'-phosphate oxidase family protein [Clostridia bacterium]|nr:pyridoxamine 5'-phosphate oxidase family protein [Clostridia bacterium]
MTRREKQVTDINEIIGILDRAKIVHVGMVDGAMPYVVPMNYGYTMEEGKLTLYLHGATQGRKLDILRENPNVFIEIDTDITPFEGKAACQYGTTYSSVMGEGVARLVEDPEGKMAGLGILMKTQTGRDFDFSEKMVAGVTVIKINITEFTAKKRPMPKREIISEE